MIMVYLLQKMEIKMGITCPNKVHIKCKKADIEAQDREKGLMTKSWDEAKTTVKNSLSKKYLVEHPFSI